VIDDHPINRLVLTKQLRSIGHAAIAVSNGMDALAEMERGGIGVVFSDCHMPGMSGYEFTREVRAVEATRSATRVPIIACTANAMEGEAARCLESGMDAYLTKPINLQRLRQVLQQWMPGGDPIDRTVLADVSAGDPAKEQELIKMFWTYNLEDVKDLRGAVAAADVAAVAGAAHRIKGASRAVGALGLAETCEKVESAARAADWTAVQASLKSFERELSLVQTRVTSMGPSQ
jgi:CheY-like chemotaxis protein